MTQHREKLSAIIDGESFTDEIIDQLKNDQSLAASWQNYNLVSDVLNNEVAEHIHLNFADQVADALANEPSIVAPVIEKNWRDKFLNISDNVVTLARQSGQFAIAASVTLAVVFGVQQYNTQQQQTPEAMISAPIIPVAINAGVSPVSLETARPISKQELLQQQQKINAYILDHQQQLRLQASQKETEQPIDAPETEDQPEDK